MSMYKINKRPRDDISADPRKNLRKHHKKGNSDDKGSTKPQKTEETVRRKNLIRMQKSELLKICRKLKINDSLNDSAPKKMDIVDHIIDHEYHSIHRVLSFEDIIKRRVMSIALDDDIVLNEEDEYSSHSELYLEPVMDDQSLSIEPMKFESVLESHYRSLELHDNDTVLGDDESKSAIGDEVSEEEVVDVMSFERILSGKGWFTPSMNDVLNKVEPKKDITAHSAHKNNNAFLKPPPIDDTISRSDMTDQLVRMSYSEEEILKAYQEVVDQQDINAIVEQIESDREMLN